MIDDDVPSTPLTVLLNEVDRTDRQIEYSLSQTTKAREAIQKHEEALVEFRAERDALVDAMSILNRATLNIPN